MNIKELTYALFAINYKLGSLFPTTKKFVFSVMTHDSSQTGNIMALTDYMGKSGSYKFYYITKEERKAFFHLLFVVPFLMSRAELFLMDNALMPMSFFKVRKKTKVVQLWHGTGSIKKFGQDSNIGRIKELEQRINSNIDSLIVNSDILINQYAGAFGVDESKVYATGLPRTDWLLGLVNDVEQARRLDDIRNKIAHFKNFDLQDKKIVLYAPTFRDEEIEEPKLHLDIMKLVKNLSENTIIFLRLHPFVSSLFKNSDLGDRIVNVSDYSDLNELMAVADGLITDYSSLIFDYCILDRPMYFFADDIVEFGLKGRGFYLDYNLELPGIIPASEEELAEKIILDLSGNEDNELSVKRRAFTHKYYKWLDGNSAKRVYETVILN